MANIMDYLKWRGDIPFTLMPLNEVDNLILATLSYVNLDEIVPGPGEGEIPIAEAVKTYEERYPYGNGMSFTDNAPRLMKACALTERFGQVRFANFRNRFDVNTEVQFCVMEILLPDGKSYIAFRGTDDTIIGWKEDFYLSIGIVPAQLEAAAYVEQVLASKDPDSRIYIGGHSKGGNLAEYAASSIREQYQDRVLQVFNNDGPGFDLSFINRETYQRIVSRTRLFVPSFGIVGELLHHGSSRKVVQSLAKTIMAHDPFTWQVMGTRFESSPALYRSAQVFNKSLSGWIDGLDSERKKAFINDFFAVLEAPGLRNISELASGGIPVYSMMAVRLSRLDPESRKIIIELIAALMENMGEWAGDTIKKMLTY